MATVAFLWALTPNYHVNVLQIGVLIEDKELVDSYMGGKPSKAGKFSFSLRLSLWSEHLGLRAGEVVNFPFSFFPD